jgi:hypothetical protein
VGGAAGTVVLRRAREELVASRGVCKPFLRKMGCIQSLDVLAPGGRCLVKSIIQPSCSCDNVSPHGCARRSL